MYVPFKGCEGGKEPTQQPDMENIEVTQLKSKRTFIVGETHGDGGAKGNQQNTATTKCPPQKEKEPKP